MYCPELPLPESKLELTLRGRPAPAPPMSVPPGTPRICREFLFGRLSQFVNKVNHMSKGFEYISNLRDHNLWPHLSLNSFICKE